MLQFPLSLAAILCDRWHTETWSFRKPKQLHSFVVVDLAHTMPSMCPPTGVSLSVLFLITNAWRPHNIPLVLGQPVGMSISLLLLLVIVGLIKWKISYFLKKIGYNCKDVAFLIICGDQGDNLFERRTHMT